jgi:hypothetical protein
MADKNLNLYKGIAASPVSQTWLTLFTTNPTADHPTAHGAVEWGPPRVRVYPNSGAGFPHWGDPYDVTAQKRGIQVNGNVTWASIVLTVSPSTVLSAGIYDAASGGNLLDWYPLQSSVVVEDGESHTFATGSFIKEHD